MHDKESYSLAIELHGDCNLATEVSNKNALLQICLVGRTLLRLSLGVWRVLGLDVQRQI